MLLPRLSSSLASAAHKAATGGAHLPATSSLGVIALPVCRTFQDTAVTALCSGSIALGAQLLLVQAFKRSDDRVLQRSAGYTAHHTVAFCFMVLATVVGFAGWFSPLANTASATSRMLVPNDTARWLAAVLFGELLIWDFLCAAFIKKLREPLMLCHHVGMLATAYLVMVLPSFYATFYLGWTELSSIPLQMWEWFGHAHDLTPDDEASGARRKRRLAQLRDVSRKVFWVLYSFARVICFTAITAVGLYPDILSLLPVAESVTSRVALKGFLIAAAGFNALMLYPVYDAMLRVARSCFTSSAVAGREA